MSLEPWQWVLAVVGALAIGLAKTGISGLGMLAVVIFANLMPARHASGFVLPMLVIADVVAVASYRRHARWSYLLKLFPWTAVGVIAGYFALGRIDDRQTRLLIGFIVLALLILHVVRRTRVKPEAEQAPEHGWWYAPVFGILAGFTTLVANAAGPLMVIYLLSMSLPKLEYMGTGAYYFLLMNLFKVPFMVSLGLIDAHSLRGDLVLLPAVIVGALLGRVILQRINQKVFENLALGLSALAGLRLLF
ncbi:MAG: sulfite exporter TauE/SafE family protein [Opitutaceae bacterium]